MIFITNRRILTTTYHAIVHTLNHPRRTSSTTKIKELQFFLSNPEKAIICLDELRQFLKECKHPEHAISKIIFNAKLRGPAPNPERSKNVIPFVTTYSPNIDNKSLIQTVKSKFKIIRNEHLKSICKDTNYILPSLKQPKKLYGKLTPSRFISNFKNIRKPGTYKCSDERFKICQNDLNVTSKFTMSNGQVSEICREIDCHPVNVIYYFKCKMCNEKETYIAKTIEDNIK